MGNNASSAAPSSAKPEPVAETSSSCVTQGTTAAHNFDVLNFSLLEGMGVGEFVSSSTFSVGDYDWRIDFYPDGHDAEYKHHVSVTLTPLQGQENSGVRARFTFTVLGKNGKVWDTAPVADYTFRPPFGDGRGMGWKTFVYKNSRGFRRLLRNNGDRFTVRCVVTVIQDPRVVAASAAVVPEPTVLRDMATMLRDGDGADVTFLVGGRSFPAHRCVLAARSAVFKAELFGDMKEKAARRVRVDDMEPSVFEALLHFVYTDTLPLPDDDDDDRKGRRNVAMQQHLLVAADRYGMDRLKAMCEDKLCRAIDVETVATALALAEQHRCVRLKDECFRFLALATRDVFGSVMRTDGFEHLVASCPELLSR